MASPRQWLIDYRPIHISKMVLPTVNLGPPNLTKSRTFTLRLVLDRSGSGNLNRGISGIAA